MNRVDLQRSVSLLTLSVLIACSPTPTPARGEVSRPAPTVPPEVVAACDSAAALARRTVSNVVNVVRDTTTDVSPGMAPSPACAVLVSMPVASAGPADFRRGFPGADWRLNLYEHTPPSEALSLWRPTVYCEITRAPKTSRAARTQLVSIFCEAQTPADTPRVVEPRAPAG